MSRQILIIVVISFAMLIADAAQTITVPIKSGDEDLLKNHTLSQPFTIFDQLLLWLDQKANEQAKNIRPEKGDFQWPKIEMPTLSNVKYDRSVYRTGIQFDLTVTGINDPWQNVCAKHVSAAVW